MTPRFGAAIAAGFLAVGILVGVASTIVVHDATTTDLANHMRGMTASAGPMGSMGAMTSMMGGGDMPGMMSMMDAGHTAEMSSMMGAGSSMKPNAWMAPDASTSLEDHFEHHASPSPAATR